MTLGLDRPVQESVAPKTAPTASAGNLVRTSDHRLDQEAHRDGGGEERDGRDEARERAHRGAAETIARRAPTRQLRPEADEHAGDDEDRCDQKSAVTGERGRQPAV